MGLRGRDDYHKCYLQPGEERRMWRARRGTCNVHLRGTGLDAQDAGWLSDGATTPKNKAGSRNACQESLRPLLNGPDTG